ncbi:MAG TPA: hypothetical protein VK988_04435 [Acidimicrobiales bacterium]|nr:hypothetical protein [Acidimicrobiales bacterium]
MPDAVEVVGCVAQFPTYAYRRRGCYLRKLAEGHSRREALRALKRRISDTVYRQLVHDAKSGTGRTSRDDSKAA